RCIDQAPENSAAAVFFDLKGIGINEGHQSLLISHDVAFVDIADDIPFVVNGPYCTGEVQPDAAQRSIVDERQLYSSKIKIVELGDRKTVSQSWHHKATYFSINLRNNQILRPGD